MAAADRVDVDTCPEGRANQRRLCRRSVDPSARGVLQLGIVAQDRQFEQSGKLCLGSPIDVGTGLCLEYLTDETCRPGAAPKTDNVHVVDRQSTRLVETDDFDGGKRLHGAQAP